MGQKANPKSIRLVLNKDWDSRWINKNIFAYIILADKIIRDTIYNKLGKTGINKIVIERGAQEIKITIFSSRPGSIIGRSGKGIMDLKKEIERNIEKSTNFNLINSKLDIKNINEIKKKLYTNIKINISEIRNHEMYAQIVAAEIAIQLEKRVMYRKAVKRSMSKVMANKNVLGIKVKVSGRLGGVEIARSEKFLEGSIPLSTFKKDIDYSYVPAMTNSGVVGIKVWIYKNNIENKK